MHVHALFVYQHQGQVNITTTPDNVMNFTVNVPKFRTLYSILFCLNFAFYTVISKNSGMANSVDPDP